MVCVVLFSVCMKLMGKNVKKFLIAFVVMFLITSIVRFISGQVVLNQYLEYAFWALLIGLLISNTVGVPEWLKPALNTEFYIKTGLVLMGATVMFSNIKKFGLYGLGIAWFVTPIVIIFMWIFGTKVLKMRNKRMVITIAVATSVCGTVDKTDDKTVGAEEIWNRLPKFVLGFLAVSLIFSFVIQPVFGAEACADIQGCFKQLQTWCFALALYVIVQTFNLILTYFICWLLLSGVMFPIPTLLS